MGMEGVEGRKKSSKYMTISKIKENILSVFKTEHHGLAGRLLSSLDSSPQIMSFVNMYLSSSPFPLNHP